MTPNPSLLAFRIADARHPIFDGSGAVQVGGRWTSPGSPVIYASLSYACAMLECLVHTGTGRIPKNQQLVRITIPAGVSVVERRLRDLPAHWSGSGFTVTRRIGDAWLEPAQSAVLIVPSASAHYERNILINPLHRDFSCIRAALPEPVIWDERLFPPGS